MKTTIQLRISPDCAILCSLFRCRIEDLLLYYMKAVNLQKLVQDRATEMNVLATALLLDCSRAEAGELSGMQKG